MAAAKSYYEVLGVSRGADEAAIKAAYRRLARQWHPDVNKEPDAAEKFREVQQAYEVLSDPEKRKLYDRVGHEAFAHGAAAGAGGGRGPTYTWSNVGGGDFGGATEGFDFGDLSDLFGEMFGGGPFGGASAGRRAAAGARARSTPRRGRDIRTERLISFDAAVRGSTEAVRVHRGGSSQTIEVTIPKGVADGAKLRVRGAGEPSPTGGTAGDLILTVRVGAHPIFRRHGLDVEFDLPLSIVEATLGATVRVPTPDGGRADLKVPPGTPSGAKLRLRGRGVENADGDRGDLYAVVKIVPPKSVTAQDRAALEALGARLPSPRRGSWWE
ncbi:MAG: J domain-containing protein [Planctomycetota bacterium]|nr:MAG: J domain-containing protein [Planctomycetota bacterium]